MRSLIISILLLAPSGLVAQKFYVEHADNGAER